MVRFGEDGDRGGRRPQQPQTQPQAARELEITDEKIFQRLLDAGLDLSQEAVIEAYRRSFARSYSLTRSSFT